MRISANLGGTKVAEGSYYDTYHVVLDTVPTANVTVHLTPDSQVSIDGNLDLVFTPGNALTPQTVVVCAVNDLLHEGDHTGLITHTSTSADASYNGLSIANINVSIIDNDAPKWVINEVDADQSGTDTMEFVELYDGGIGNLPVNGLSLVFFNGSNDTSYENFNLSGSTDAEGFFLVGQAPGVSGRDQDFPVNVSLQNGADAVALFNIAASNFSSVTVDAALAAHGASLLDAMVYDNSASTPDDSGLLQLLVAAEPQVTETTSTSSSRVPDGGAAEDVNLYRDVSHGGNVQCGANARY